MIKKKDQNLSDFVIPSGHFGWKLSKFVVILYPQNKLRMIRKVRLIKPKGKLHVVRLGNG